MARKNEMDVDATLHIRIHARMTALARPCDSVTDLCPVDVGFESRNLARLRAWDHEIRECAVSIARIGACKAKLLLNTTMDHAHVLSIEYLANGTK